MKSLEILSGSFSNNGNFTGYTLLGRAGRVFVHKNQMESLGWTKKEDVKYPFYVIGTNETYNKLDENNKPVIVDGKPETFERFTASAVFKEKAALIQAKVNAISIDVEVATEVKRSAEKAGLTEADMKQLLAEAV